MLAVPLLKMGSVNLLRLHHYWCATSCIIVILQLVNRTRWCFTASSQLQLPLLAARVAEAGTQPSHATSAVHRLRRRVSPSVILPIAATVFVGASRYRAQGGPIPTSRPARVVCRAGQTIKVNPEIRTERIIRQSTVAALHELLLKDGLKIMMSGAESQELAEEPGQVYCYLSPLEIPGVQKTQIRLTCSLSLPRPGLAILQMHELANLLEDESNGVMVFDETWSTRGSVRAEVTNTLTFRQVGSDLSVVYYVRTSCVSPLPEWVTISIDPFNALINGFAAESLKVSSNALLDTIEQRCASLR